MAKLVEFKSNFDETYVKFLDFKANIKQEVVLNGLDNELAKSVQILKTELMSIISNKVSGVELTEPKKPLTENKIQPDLNTSKSKEALVKHFTGVDLREYKNQKDKTDYYTVVNKPKLVFARPSRGQDSAARVTLKMPIKRGETVESQYIQAMDFFKNTVYAFPNQQGDFDFFLDLGSNLKDALKIKCSTQTGFGDSIPEHGLSPEERFERDKKKKRYAEWTLKQEYVKNIQKSGINLSQLIQASVEGNYEEARIAAASIAEKNRKVAEDINQKIDQLENNKELDPDVQTYNSIISLVRNIKLEKELRSSSARYKLVSSYGKLDKKVESFENEIQNHISMWKNVNVDKWVQVILEKIKEVTNKFYQGS